MLTSVDEFVGREAVLAELRRLFSQLNSGGLLFCVLEGQPGIGKSSLLERLIKDISASQAQSVIAMARCDSSARAQVPYSVLGQVLPTLLAEQSEASEVNQREQIGKILRLSGGLLKEFTPDLLEMVLPGSAAIVKRTSSVLTDKDEMDELVEQVVSSQDDQSEKLAALIAQISAQQPLLLIVDDTHLADPATLDVFMHLLQNHPNAPVMLLLALRNSYLQQPSSDSPDSLEKLLLQKKAFEFDLDDLEETERRAFIDALIDIEANELDANFREQLFKKTDGHPLMTKELLRALVSNGSIDKSPEDRWQLAGQINWNHTPNDLTHALKLRVQSLSAQELELLGIASAFDGEIILAIVADFLGRPAWEITKIFTKSLQNDLAILRETRAFRVGDDLYIGFRFREPLLREYLYNQLGRGERMHIHEAISSGLRRFFADNIQSVSSELSWHYEKAGRYQEAIRLMLEAASHAVQLGALSEALMHTKRGLNVLYGLLEGAEKDTLELNFLILKGKILRAREGWSSSLQDYLNKRIRLLANRTGKTAMMESILLAEWSSYLMRAQIEPSIETAKQLLGIGMDNQDDLSKISGHAYLANSLFWHGDVLGAYDNAVQALDLYQSQYSEELIKRNGFDPICIAYMFAVWSSHLLGRFKQLRKLEEDTQLTANHPHKFTSVIAKMTLVWQASHENDPKRTLYEARKLKDFAVENEFNAYIGLADIFIGWAEARLTGDLHGGLELLERGCEVWFSSSGTLITTYVGLLKAELLMQAQGFDQAHREIDRAFSHLQSSAERAYNVDLLLARGDNLRHAPRPDMDRAACYAEGLSLARAGQQKVAELKLLIRLKKMQAPDFDHLAGDDLKDLAQAFLHQQVPEALQALALQLPLNN